MHVRGLLRAAHNTQRQLNHANANKDRDDRKNRQDIDKVRQGQEITFTITQRKTEQSRWFAASFAVLYV